MEEIEEDKCGLTLMTGGDVIDRNGEFWSQTAVIFFFFPPL